MSCVKLDTNALVSLRESFALRIADGGLPAALSPAAPVPDTRGDTAVARGELCKGELLALSLPRPGIGTGLEDLDICRGDVPEPVATTEGPEGPTPTALGLDERDKRLGVAGGVLGGVAPLPLALDSPIAFTRSFTDTPCSSGGTSLGMLTATCDCFLSSFLSCV